MPSMEETLNDTFYGVQKKSVQFPVTDMKKNNLSARTLKASQLNWFEAS